MQGSEASLSTLQAQIITENEYRNYYKNNLTYEHEKIVCIFTNYINTYRNDIERYIKKLYEYMCALFKFLEIKYSEIENIEKNNPYYIMQYIRQFDNDINTGIEEYEKVNIKLFRANLETWNNPKSAFEKAKTDTKTEQQKPNKPVLISPHPSINHDEIKNIIQKIENKDLFESIQIVKSYQYAVVPYYINIVQNSKLSEIFSRIEKQNKRYRPENFRKDISDEFRRRETKYKINLLIIHRKYPQIDKILMFISKCQNKPTDGNKLLYLVREGEFVKANSNEYKLGIVNCTGKQTLESRFTNYKTKKEYDINGKNGKITEYELYGYWWCDRHADIEYELKYQTMPNKFARSSGTESFRGDINEIIITINEVVERYNKTFA